MRTKFSELPIGSLFELNTFIWRKRNDNVVKGILTDEKHNAVIISSANSNKSYFRSEGKTAYIGPNRNIKKVTYDFFDSE